MPKIIIELDTTLVMTGPAKCTEGMESEWWKKFASAAVGVDWINLCFLIDPDLAEKPPMKGTAADFSDISLLSDTGSLCFQQSCLLDGELTSALDGKAKSLEVTLKGRFGFWAGSSDDNDDNWDQISLPNSAKGTDPIPALKRGKFLFATVCRPVDKKGKVVKTNTTQFGTEMYIQLAPDKDLALPVPYKFHTA
jgi:hypothetical protein